MSEAGGRKLRSRLAAESHRSLLSWGVGQSFPVSFFFLSPFLPRPYFFSTELYAPLRGRGGSGPGRLLLLLLLLHTSPRLRRLYLFARVRLTEDRSGSIIQGRKNKAKTKHTQHVGCTSTTGAGWSRLPPLSGCVSASTGWVGCGEVRWIWRVGGVMLVSVTVCVCVWFSFREILWTFLFVMVPFLFFFGFWSTATSCVFLHILGNTYPGMCVLDCCTHTHTRLVVKAGTWRDEGTHTVISATFIFSSSSSSLWSPVVFATDTLGFWPLAFTHRRGGGASSRPLEQEHDLNALMFSFFLLTGRRVKLIAVCVFCMWLLSVCPMFVMRVNH